jgi:hypothetical protein
LLDLYARPRTDKTLAGPGASLKSWKDSRKRVEVVFARLLEAC